MLISDEAQLIIASNRSEDTIGIFAPGPQPEVTKIAVGVHPNGLAFDAKRRVIIVANLGDPAILGSYTLSVVDLDARQKRSEGDDQRRIDLRVVAAVGDVGPIRRGQGGADLRHRALGAGIRAAWHPRQHRVTGLDTGRGQWLGPLSSRQPGLFRRLRPPWFSEGPPRHRRGVADVIVFVASPRAYWVNGRNIPVDGLEQPHAPLDRRPY